MSRDTLPAVALVFLMLLAPLSLAANDPGHDSLYVLRVGDTNITGSINLTGNLNASFVKITQRLFGDYLDVVGNGTVLGSPSQPRVMGASNALYIDSPFDGRPLRDVRERRDIAMPDPWHRAPERMQAVFGYPVVRNLGVCAMSVRSPIKGLLLCGAQVVPGFGVEGEFLAAWTAAGIITRTDRQKERMRRELWSKVEI